MTDAIPRRQRADAARNRAGLVEVAAAAFAEEGLGVSVNEIAARAGVSPATLYRHFATKDALIFAVADRLVAPLVAACEAGLAARGPASCLEVFLHHLLREQARNQGFVDAIVRSPSSSTAVRDRLRGASLAAVRPLVARAHADGVLCPDLDAADLLLWPFLLGVLGRAGSDLPAERLERAVNVVVRGLAPSGDRTRP